MAILKAGLLLCRSARAQSEHARKTHAAELLKVQTALSKARVGHQEVREQEACLLCEPISRGDSVELPFLCELFLSLMTMIPMMN